MDVTHLPRDFVPNFKVREVMNGERGSVGYREFIWEYYKYYVNTILSFFANF